MNKDELTIRREATKRMIHKNMDLDYIKEITKLSKKQIKDIRKTNDSIIGDNDYYLRKKYASAHNLQFGYYFKEKTMFSTGVEMEESEFYKNKYVARGHMDLKDNIDLMEKYYANILRIKAMGRIFDYTYFTEELFMACKIPYSWPKHPIYNCEIYTYIKYKIKDFEEKKG